MLKFILCILVLILILYVEPSIGILLLLCTILWAFWAKHADEEQSERETGSAVMGTKIEQLKQEQYLVTVEIAESDSDFREPVFEDPGMIPDPHTCMAKVEENEELAARARAYGRDDLAEQYESVAARWRYLYEEAEDEEMEW